MKRAALALLLAACHTPEWRVAEIHEQIAAVNTPSHDKAVARTLEENHAKPTDLLPKTIFFRSELNECTDAESVVETQDKQALHVSCNGLRNALFSGGAVDAKSEDGTQDLALVAYAPLAGDSSSGFFLATTASGELLLVRAHLNVVRKRKIWRAGTCNFMPSPVELHGRSAQMFVLPARRAADIRAVDVTYDGEETEIICDQRVE